MSNGDIIRSSEIGEYIYCARAWWLSRVQGVESRNLAALEAGQTAHDRHARTVVAFQRQRRLALIFLGLAIVAALAALAVAAGGGGW